MVDAEVRPGDVVHDLVERGKMQVVAIAADSVAAYREREDFDLAAYKSHPLLGVGDDEPVYTCVYLPDAPTATFSGTYDFPRSRLARVPVEEANADLDRIQNALAIDLLEKLFTRAAEDDENAVAVLERYATDAGIDADAVAAARELAAADQIGGDGA
ncbi:hypothetical protein [Salinilacihabitans rarus]|uniref:hypothetical protein n=1 Tax=Salinilacihabitans rarus TaxID=2961596 RepID=UPI0020C83B79|nr:hypothetical protein [Salinilacihabitans rarus]